MSFKQFLKEKESGFTKKAYLLYGTDPFFLKEAERIIKEGIDKDHQDFGIDMYDLESATGRAASLKEVLDSLNTFSFFSENKVVIAQNIQKLKKAELELFGNYLMDPSDSSTLFIFCNDKLKATVKNTLSKCMMISLDHTGHELKGWLSAHAQTMGISLSAEVMDYVTVMLGNDAGLIASEVNKLSLLGIEKIEINDLADIIYGEVGVDTFELTRAISAGDMKKAFQLSKDMAHTDTNMLLGAINWQVSKMKGSKSPEKMMSYYKAMLDADTINKSTGSDYPLELLITKLLYR